MLRISARRRNEVFCFGFEFVAVSVIQIFSITEGMEVHESSRTENCIGGSYFVLHDYTLRFLYPQI
ncbi:Os04g0498400 [Oryza sativa Japonica Group]|jgi:hypothetical protein|uniref:Os04g0498400 protein n=3 Tax=Oryza sativa TaxID=4530 RepID=B9EUT6_ORYSJ|nr:hypothetical protein OsI_16494 [Oryza sativa Indica Group]EEE55712.1 hypothetical protein OsJ_04174 [Oryza sativa Japonica Group]KAB8095948.1 hypothetical protein EE612_024208 [Oryza sativa]BAS89908.1 Os04g0498400 [Oryza sativa Japonica Group]